MGQLQHLITKVEPDDIAEKIDSGFTVANDTLRKNLLTLTEHAAELQHKALAEAIRSTVDIVNDSQKTMLQAFANLQKQVAAEIRSVDVSKKVEQVATGIGNLTFPEPEKVDLSGVQKLIGDLSRDIKNIPKPEKVDLSDIMDKLAKLPDVDISPQLKDLEERLDKRVYRFKVERDPFNDLIKEIVVTEK